MSSSSAEEPVPAEAVADPEDSSVPAPAGGQDGGNGADKEASPAGAEAGDNDGTAGGQGAESAPVEHVLPDDVLGGRLGGAFSYREFVDHPLLKDADNTRRDVWRKKVERGCLSALEKNRFMAADLVIQPRDESLAGVGAACYARIQELPAAIALELGKTDIGVSASVLRWPEEMSYLRRALGVWDEHLKVERGDLVLPGPRYVALKPFFLLRNYSGAHGQRVQGERRARIKGMVISHNH